MSDDKLDINDLKNIVKGFEGLEKYIELLYEDIRTLAKVQQDLLVAVKMLSSNQLIVEVGNNMLDDILKRTEFLEKNK